MDFFKKAAAATSAAAKLAADAAKKTYVDLKAEPTQVRCTACPHEIEVPPTAFQWTCAAGHVNKRSDEMCTECKVAQPANLPDPTVTCPACQTVTVVPASNARKHVRETAVKTKEFAVATAAATKQGVEHLRAAPTTFHCGHCNTLLAVPTGPWACQTCSIENEEGAKVCRQCGQKKSEQKAICGVRQSTAIPASNFSDSLKSGVKNLEEGSKKVYYDVAGKPYLTCGKCSAHVTIAKKDVGVAAGAGAGAAAAGSPRAPVHEGEGLGSPPAAGGAAPGGAPSAAAPEGVYHGETVICPSCKNPIEGVQH